MRSDRGFEELLAEAWPDGAPPASQVALFAGLPDERRQQICNRLQALLELRALQPRSAAAVAAVAESIGISRSKLYHLEKAWKAEPGIAALAPYATRTQKPRLASDLNDCIDKAIETLGAVSDVNVSGEAVRRLAAELAGQASLSAPSGVAVRARLAHARHRRASTERWEGRETDGPGSFGEILLVDTSALDLVREAEGQVSYVCLTLVLDEFSGLVVGWCESPGGVPSRETYAEAFARAASAIEQFNWGRLPRKSEHTFVVVRHPSRPEDRDTNEIAALAQTLTPLGVGLRDVGRQGAGKSLLHRLPAGVGGVALLPRKTLEKAGSRLPNSKRPKLHDEGLIERVIEAHNAGVLSTMLDAGITLGRRPRRDRLKAKLLSLARILGA